MESQSAETIPNAVVPSETYDVVLQYNNAPKRGTACSIEWLYKLIFKCELQVDAIRKLNDFCQVNYLEASEGDLSCLGRLSDDTYAQRRMLLHDFPQRRE